MGRARPQARASSARCRRRTPSVGAHLVMAGRLHGRRPGLAYEHAQAAVRRAGRVGSCARPRPGRVPTGRYAEALRELRTRPPACPASRAPRGEADCERGLGRPERALGARRREALADSRPTTQARDCAIVASGPGSTWASTRRPCPRSSAPQRPGPVRGRLRERLAGGDRSAVLDALGQAAPRTTRRSPADGSRRSSPRRAPMGRETEVADDDVARRSTTVLDRPMTHVPDGTDVPASGVRRRVARPRRRRLPRASRRAVRVRGDRSGRARLAWVPCT